MPSTKGKLSFLINAHPREIIDSKYIILQKLGWGHFSTVWLALCLHDKRLYALKFQKSAKKYTESAYDEEGILKVLHDNYNSEEWVASVRRYQKDPGLEVRRHHCCNLQMFDSFFHFGPNGKHFVMAFEVLGKNLLALMKKYEFEGIPVPIVREITRQLLIGLDYMHRICKLIHTDLKPENIVFGLKEQEKKDLLYKNVLSTKLADIYESKERVILNKKQQKNAKKRERKKKKKAATATSTAEEEKREEECEEAAEEEKKEDGVEETKKEDAVFIKA